MSGPQDVDPLCDEVLPTSEQVVTGERSVCGHGPVKVPVPGTDGVPGSEGSPREPMTCVRLRLTSGGACEDRYQLGDCAQLLESVPVASSEPS